MEQQGEGVGFAAAELGGQVEDRAGLRPLAGEAPHDFAGQGGEVFGDVGARKEAVGLLVVRRGAVIANVVQVDCELGGVEGFAFAQVLARGDDFIPGLEAHIGECGSGVVWLFGVSAGSSLNRSAWRAAICPDIVSWNKRTASTSLCMVLICRSIATSDSSSWRS